ncbi:MAG: hypothetical protein V4717_12650 [Bacteroidota bacterium]
MKHTFVSLKTTLFCLGITGFMATISSPVMAHGNKDNNITAVSSQPAVSYVNTDDAGSTFRVTFDTQTKAKFELSVQDANGNILFKGIYESDKFSKYIKLLEEGVDIADLSFSIRVITTGQVHTFNVSSNTVLIKDVVVKKQ